MKRTVAILVVLVLFILPVSASDAFKLTKAKYEIKMDGESFIHSIPIMDYNGNTCVSLREFVNFLRGDIKVKGSIIDVHIPYNESIKITNPIQDSIKRNIVGTPDSNPAPLRYYYNQDRQIVKVTNYTVGEVNWNQIQSGDDTMRYLLDGYGLEFDIQ